MKSHIRALVISLAFSAALTPALAFATNSEIHIDPAGALTAKSLIVLQKSGNNLFTRAYWGDAFIRVAVLVGTSTLISKNHGEAMTVADIKEGHVLDVEGGLSIAAESLIIKASSIRDSALVQESKTLSGTIASFDSSKALTFVLPNKTFGSTTVVVSPSLNIIKGARTIDFTGLLVGDKVLSVSGTYDYPSNTLTARALEIFQPKDMFKPRNFQGTLKSISGTTLPATAIVTVDGTDYTMYLGAKATVLNNKKATTSLKRFAEGDTVRLYGAIRQTNFTEVDAEIIRDLNF